MALDLEQRWLLVASATIAHADGTLDGYEVERLMALIDDETDSEDYVEWMGILSDAARLKATLENLPPLPPEAHRDVLRDAWLIAATDGQRSAVERAALFELGRRLGVEAVQLEHWEAAWSEQQDHLMTMVAQLLAAIFGDTPSEHQRVHDLLERLTATQPRRDEAFALATTPRSVADVVDQLRSSPRRDRQWALKAIAPSVGDSPDSNARRRFLALAASLDETPLE